MQKEATYKVLDYDPFGSAMPSRSFSGASGYKFGFNGMEKSDVANDEYTTHYRQYNSRLGRWNSLDPKMFKYPFQSPYASFNNNPIYWTDPYGDDPPDKAEKHTIQKGQTLSGIAEKKGTTVENLMKWNENIKDKDKINAGDVINVSDPNRWVGESNGVWLDTQNPNERWTKDGNGGWQDMNAQTFGDWYASEAESQGEVWQMSDEDIQALKSICVDMVSWGMYAYGSGNSNVTPKGLKPPKGIYKPPLRMKYEAEIYELKKIGETMLKNGNSKEVVAKTLSSMRRNIGVKYKAMTPKKMQNEIYERNMEIYGDKYGPTVEWFLSKGKTYDQIISGAARPGGKDIIFGIKF